VTRRRLDQLLHERGLAKSREQAKRLILAGQVRVDGQVEWRASTPVAEDARVEVSAGLPYVSRGGLKLQKALDVFGLQPQGWVVADIGASTGGFTDCLLQHGAARVYAIDVGYGQLAWSLRQDPRVVVMERTNARNLARLPEPVRLVTCDASFISVRLLLEPARGWLTPDGEAIVLVKPQFEAGRELVGKGGVVRSTDTHRTVLRSVVQWAGRHGWYLRGLTLSPITGPKGNREFLLWLGLVPRAGEDPVAEEAIEHALTQSVVAASESEERSE